MGSEISDWDKNVQLSQKINDQLLIVEAQPYYQQERLKLIDLQEASGSSIDAYLSWVGYTKLFYLTDEQIQRIFSAVSDAVSAEKDEEESLESEQEDCLETLLDHQPSFTVVKLYLQYVIQNKADRLLDHYFIQDKLIKNIQYDFDKSDQVWDRIVSYYEESMSSDKEQLAFVKSLYQERLQVPHKTIEKTFSNFSSFVSKYFNDNYNSEMSKASKLYEKAKSDQWDIEALELKRPTYEDQSQFWIDYLNYWASKPKKQRSLKPIKAVLHRAAAESTESSYIKVWIRFLLILYENGAFEDDIIPYSKRFVRAFPSSPLSYAELFKNIQSGPLFTDLYQNSLERLTALNLLQTEDYENWSALVSSILIFELKSVLDGNLDLAEQLLSHLDAFFHHALENCPNVYHSVERLCVSIAEQIGEVASAREFLKLITTKFGSESENWLISHNFEKKHGDTKSASKILLAAVNRSTGLDWPERIFEEALLHEKVHGDANTYNSLLVKIDKKTQEIQLIRSQAVIETQPIEPEDVIQDEEISTKRKADDEQTEEDSNKRQKTDTHRDREHLTVSVKNIPLKVNEKQVLSFFKDCGEIAGSSIVKTDDSFHAKLEFVDKGSLLKALTKDHKRFHGSELRVEKAFQTVIWVTNFPPSTTQEDINTMFSPVGKISEIRFPSLKFNSQRRFCYVEFLESKDAQKAVEQLSGIDKDGYKLVVKISNPESKESRKGAVEEGREVYVAKLDFYKATSEKLKDLFSKYGTVERVHLPRSEQSKAQNKKHDGYGFVTFATPEEAQSSLELNLVSFEGRAIEVSISKKKSERIQIKETSALEKYKNSDNSIALLNVPDTINAVQITNICSEAGEVDEVILESDHQGAVVLFKDPRDAGKASLLLNGKSTGLSGYNLKVGTIQELKSSKTDIEVKPKANSGSRKPLVPSSLRRKPKVSKPTAPSEPKTEMADATSTDKQETKTTARSNDDFRAIFLAGKK